MSLILWGVAMFLTGILVFIATPIFLGPSLGVERRNKLAQWYYNQAMSAFRRVLLVERKHSGYSLCASSYDAEIEAEKINLDDETYKVEDAKNWMTRLKNRPFGIMHERRNVLVHPMVAEIGEFINKRNADGNEWLVDDEGRRRVNAHVKIPDGFRLIDFSHITKALPGTATPKDAETSTELAKKSQAGYKSHNVVQMMSLMIAFVVGCGVAWFIWSNTGRGDSVVTVPITMALSMGWF